MAGKKDIHDLVKTLNQLCLEHLALQYVLRHYCVQDNWAKLVQAAENLPGFQSRVRSLLDAQSEQLQRLAHECDISPIIDILFGILLDSSQRAVRSS